MSVETTNLKQKAVLWAFSSFDASGGIQVSSPVEINVRWEEVKSQSTGAETVPEGSTISVYVDRVITNGSVMRLGKLRQLPSPVDKVMEVVNFDEVPDLKARKFQRTVSLRKYGGSLPPIV